MDFDPRWNDDPRDDDHRDGLRREESGRELNQGSRGVSSDPLERDARDPREVFTRDLDLPRGPNRERVCGRDFNVLLRGSESRALAVRLPNATTDLATLTATLKTSDAYTALFVKRAAGVGLVLLADTNTAPAAGKVRFRFVNAAQAGNLDVYVTAANADLATATPISAAIEPEKAGTYVSVDAGTYRIRFTNAGTKTVVLDVAAAAFAQGQVRTITVIEAAAGGAPLRAVVSADRG